MKFSYYLILFFLIFSSVLALPVENPSDPRMINEGVWISPASWIFFRAGYEGNFVGDRRLKQEIDGSRRVDKFSIDTNSAILTLNILNRLDMYGVLGESRLRSNWRIEDDALRFFIEMDSKFHFSWGAGAKAVLLEWNDTTLAFGGRYYRTEPNILWLTKDGDPYSVDGSIAKFREWQIDLSLSHKIQYFIPYIGVIYSRATAQINDVNSTDISDDGSGNLKMKSRDNVGLALGYGSTSGKWYMVNLEIRMFTESGVSASGGIRF